MKPGSQLSGQAGGVGVGVAECVAAESRQQQRQVCDENAVHGCHGSVSSPQAHTVWRTHVSSVLSVCCFARAPPFEYAVLRAQAHTPSRTCMQQGPPECVALTSLSSWSGLPG